MSCPWCAGATELDAPWRHRVLLRDRTSYRTGLIQLKNTAPYPGISLNVCPQAGRWAVKMSSMCFSNPGIVPDHPSVIAKVRPVLLNLGLQCQWDMQEHSSSC